MKFFIRFAEVLVGDVGIDLGRSDTAMAKHALDTTNIGTIHKEVSSKAMPHGVRADMLGDASKTCIFANHTLDAAGAKPTVVSGC